MRALPTYFRDININRSVHWILSKYADRHYVYDAALDNDNYMVYIQSNIKRILRTKIYIKHHYLQ